MVIGSSYLGIWVKPQVMYTLFEEGCRMGAFTEVSMRKLNMEISMFSLRMLSEYDSPVIGDMI